MLRPWENVEELYPGYIEERVFLMMRAGESGVMRRKSAQLLPRRCVQRAGLTRAMTRS